MHRSTPSLRFAFLLALATALAVPLAGASRTGPGVFVAEGQEKGRARLDAAALDTLLSAAPLEGTKDAFRAEVALELPLPDGSVQRFRIEESPVMEPLLAAKFPEIRTYRGQGLTDPTATVRLMRTPAHFEAQILRLDGIVRITETSEPGVYQSEAWHGATFGCGTRADRHTPLGRVTAPAVSGAALRKYRLAVASTADFTTLSGGTKQTAMTAIAGYVNRLNAVYERDLTVHFELVANNDQLVFLTKPDGYDDTNADQMLEFNQTKVDAVIGTANYDAGMVFARSQPGSGNGVAQLQSICDPASKAKNSQRIPSTDGAWDSVAFHETAHQFGASHTYNSTKGPCAAQREASSAWEPGGGTTLMSYATVCDNLQDNEDKYFHGGSLEQMNAFIATATCTGTTVSGNTPPVVTIPNGPFTVPKGTPFALTASATSANQGLTYCWEGLDVGTASESLPDLDDGSRPLFRSFLPTTSPTRTFPRMTDVLSGIATKGESLPTTNRTMKFRVTVRDNKAGGGAVNEANTTVTVAAAAGPFTVTAPAAGATLPPGSAQTVIWTVAGTDAAPLSIANVKISLSSDGGTTFPTVLAESVPNNGSHGVTLPNANNLAARIKVEPVSGIFFAVSPGFFVRPTCGTLSIAPTTLPDAPVQVTYSPVTLTATGGTPPYTFTVTAGPNNPNTGVPDVPWALTLSAAGVLGGSAQDAGTSTFTVTATDSVQCTATQVYTLNAVAQANIGDAGATVGGEGRSALALVPVTFTVSLTSPSSSPVTLHYETDDESAVAGQDYTAASGTLTFAPGETTQTITVMVNGSPDGTVDESFQVLLSQPNGVIIEDGVAEGEILEPEPGSCPDFSVTPPSLAIGRRGVPYSQSIGISGGATLQKAVIFGGTLPPGLALNAATGAISGTPRAVVSYSIDVDILDVNGCWAAKTFPLDIDPPVPSITSISPASGAVGTPVVVTGAGLLGATRVSIGGKDAATITLSSDGRLVASVPVGAATGTVSVTTPGGSASSATSFTVVNSKPIALDGTAATSRDMSVTGRLAASDPDGKPLTYSIYPLEKSTGGTAVVTNASTGDFTYTPKSGFVGTDAFFFQAYDGSSASNVAKVTVSISAPGACTPNATSLCLNGNRFRVAVAWKNPYDGGSTGVGKAVPLTSDSGTFWFFTASNIELVIKILDGRTVNGKFWVLYGALSDVEYTITITDTQTAYVKSYFNPGRNLASIADVNALPGSRAGFAYSEEASPQATYGQLATHLLENGGEAERSAALSTLPAGGTGNASSRSPLASCSAAADTLCLTSSRFQVRATWKNYNDGSTGSAIGVRLTDDSGTFWFFNAANVELMIKILDGRSTNGKFWVLYGALSDVEYAITVTDTQTGTVKTYANAAHKLASVADITAF